MSKIESGFIDDDFSDIVALFSGKKVDEVASLLLAMAAKHRWNDNEVMDLAWFIEESIAFAVLCKSKKQVAYRK